LPLLPILVLSVVQGATEFLPVSSSGHLILVPSLTGWPDQGLAIDVAAHLGTLLAVLVYFWRDVGRMGLGLFRMALGRVDAGGRLVVFLLVATVPALAVGYVFDRYFSASLRDPQIVAWALIVFGVVLFVADRVGMTIRRMEHMSVGQALVIGAAQVLAFIPGTSRSGITMTAARMLGYERAEAARFSFLLSIPAISAAGLWKGWHLFGEGDPAALQDAAMTAGFSAVAGFLAIAFLMAWLRRATFAPFVGYRIILGAGLLWLIYSGSLGAAGT
jgi:undecaprenyl-diphosphatase